MINSKIYFLILFILRIFREFVFCFWEQDFEVEECKKKKERKNWTLTEIKKKI